jgi:hypothetical protein
MTEPPPVSGFAASFVARHPRLADFVDSDGADGQAALLRASGLDGLNVKVLQSPAGEVLDVIAEHNAAAMLLRRGFKDVQHEPPVTARPVDLVGTHGGRCYRVEVKRLSASELEDLRDTVMYTLNKALESDAGSIMIAMCLRELFEAQDTNALVRHVKKSLRDPRMDHVYAFAPDEEEAVAWYKFHPSDRSHPYVGILGDLDGVMRDVTGEDVSRVQRKVRRAYEKFKVCSSDDAAHLVLLELDRTIDLFHVAGALYGQQFDTWSREGYAGSGREPGGAFSRGLHSRLGGLVVARRADRHRVFCGYEFTLFVNPGGTLPVPDVVSALGVEKVYGPDDFPSGS